ncbi:MAG: pyruvate formate-lyase-activating protein [Oscillospiraceae bacterium]|nr:pyruvate formate-lyase-activating protein [Oscillospiraceae bacterium]
MSELLGKIHSIETFGAVDGPGIRFVIFMQGCSLRCQYCQNRDTWDLKAGTEMSVDEMVSKIKRYKEYIVNSGGGVTATGGEPLLQAKFLINLFKELKAQGYHTALDTAGIVSINEDMKELLSFTDLVLLDIKHIDDEKCKKLTGLSNKLSLEFGKYLSDQKIPIWIRQVIVPGITDAEQDLLALKKYIDSLNTVEKIELLPFHQLGKYKWQEFDGAYELEDVPDATSNDIEKAKKILGI